MIVSTAISWQSINWPTSTVAATKYAIFLGAATSPLQTVTDITATVSYDDTTSGSVFIIRPTDGAPTPSYGPAQAVFVGTGPQNNRAWFRTYIRRTIGDRIDTSAGNTPNVADDEINDYLNDALRKYSGFFPRETQTTYTLVGAQRDYTLPTDYLSMLAVQYRSVDSNYRLMLREEPFKGGETTPTSWVGYPKLGVYQPVWGGRFYSGRYEIHDNGTGTKTLSLDFDPPGDGDSLLLHYRAAFLFPADDLAPIAVPSDDLEGLGLYVQGKCWLQIEARDVSLSRWREGSKRDDLPTEKMSTRMFNAWNVWIENRLTQRPKNIRLIRRT